MLHAIVSLAKIFTPAFSLARETGNATVLSGKAIGENAPCLAASISMTAPRHFSVSSPWASIFSAIRSGLVCPAG